LARLSLAGGRFGVSFIVAQSHLRACAPRPC
jgi:hypothetical protein